MGRYENLSRLKRRRQLYMTIILNIPTRRKPPPPLRHPVGSRCSKNPSYNTQIKRFVRKFRLFFAVYEGWLYTNIVYTASTLRGWGSKRTQILRCVRLLVLYYRPAAAAVYIVTSIHPRGGDRWGLRSFRRPRYIILYYNILLCDRLYSCCCCRRVLHLSDLGVT